MCRSFRELNVLVQRKVAYQLASGQLTEIAGTALSQTLHSCRDTLVGQLVVNMGARLDTLVVSAPGELADLRSSMDPL